ncbi:SDR family oxidoreductase [Streptomyces buecherae]|uniref:SDR family oxidoreductase n=1 Tax=Streptomyces buecherae TaxID=2763006 RepID=A0A7H8N7A8_9ACTN|nr:SDR family oxidoreductase [Streptomyces buecherae]QKW49738.1 SDR family oxidoreductase [Streptomyces buecherae]
MTIRLLTGATGFVGGTVVLELLERTEGVIYAMVRGSDDEVATKRLHEALNGLAEGYGRPELATAIAERTRAIRGDMTVAGGGVDLATAPRIDELWHCAASLRYEEEYREEIEAQNIGGTRNILQLAQDLGATTFNYVSTSYVAGARRGLIREVRATDTSVANNSYERSKIQAEALVLDAADRMRVRVLRPSIVIGHSVTRHGINWSGMYGFARQVLLFKRVAGRRLGVEMLPDTPVRLLADPESRLNFVPVDMVARNAVSIALSDSPETFFHLANSEQPTTSDVITTVMDLVGLPSPVWASDTTDFTPVDDVFDKGMDFYRPHMKNSKTFDLTHTDAVCGADASRAPMGIDDLAEYVLYFLRQQRGFDESAGLGRVVKPATERLRVA